MTSCGCREPRALFAPTCARARYQYGLVEFSLRVWEYSDDTMAVDPTFSYDSSPSFERDIWGGWSCWPTFVANVLSCGPMDKASDYNSLKFAGSMVLNQHIIFKLFTLHLVKCCRKSSCMTSPWMLPAKVLIFPGFHGITAQYPGLILTCIFTRLRRRRHRF